MNLPYPRIRLRRWWWNLPFDIRITIVTTIEWLLIVGSMSFLAYLLSQGV